MAKPFPVSYPWREIDQAGACRLKHDGFSEGYSVEAKLSVTKVTVLTTVS